MLRRFEKQYGDHSTNKDTGNKDTGNKDTGNKDTGNKDTGDKDTGPYQSLSDPESLTFFQDTETDRCTLSVQQLSAALGADDIEYSGFGLLLERLVREQLRETPDIHIEIQCSGLHPDVFSLAALSATESRCSLTIQYPMSEFANEVQRRDALVPLTVYDRPGPRAIRADELFPNHRDLVCMPGGEVISRSLHHVVGRVVGNLVFIEPLPGEPYSSLYPERSEDKSRKQSFLSEGSFPRGFPCSLRNMGPDGYPRYDFSASYHGLINDTHLLSRIPPGTIAHHKSGRTFPIDNPELVFIPNGECHVISLALNNIGQPESWYVNINNPVTIGVGQFSWEDWELDLKVLTGDDGCFYPLLLDLDEFEDAKLPYTIQESCCLEIERCIDAIYQQNFPFHQSFLQNNEIHTIIDSLYK